MAETLLSVGLDVGTTSTQLVVSRLVVENQASAFAVPEMTISNRQVIYKSPVYFTPLVGEELVDGDGIRRIVEQEYRQAKIRREDVDTGAVIITGETSRRENARAVLAALADYAGDFVVATAGPALESILAAKGAGAVTFSEETGKTVLHMDIGGGTANLALIRQGKVEKTGCLNVGGRLIKLNKDGIITYLSPVLRGISTPLKTGGKATPEALEEVAHVLAQGLEMAAGLRPATDLLRKLWTTELGTEPAPMADGDAVISFSGGVADCIEQNWSWLSFGDMGPALGKAIRDSLLCKGEYRLGAETIRATVIGAGSHSAQLSGSTVYLRKMDLPIKNLPVICLNREEQQLPQAELSALIRQKRQQQDTEAVLSLPGYRAPEYRRVKELAAAIAEGLKGQRILIALEEDMAKALGQAVCMSLPGDAPCLCIDRVQLTEGSFLDVGVPVGPALPVVVKTLILQQ